MQTTTTAPVSANDSAVNTIFQESKLTKLRKAAGSNIPKSMFAVGIALLSGMMYIELTKKNPTDVRLSSAGVNIIMNTGGAAGTWAHFVGIYNDSNKSPWAKAAEIALKFGLVGGAIAFGFGLIGLETTTGELTDFSVFANAVI